MKERISEGNKTNYEGNLSSLNICGVEEAGGGVRKRIKEPYTFQSIWPSERLNNNKKGEKTRHCPAEEHEDVGAVAIF